MLNKHILIIAVLLALSNCAFSFFIQLNVLSNRQYFNRTFCLNTGVATETLPVAQPTIPALAPPIAAPTTANGANSITCDTNSVLKIQSAIFGLVNLNNCPARITGDNIQGPNDICDERIEATRIVKGLCERNPGNNNNQCIIYVRNLIATFNLPVHCRSVAGQYLQVTYTCLSNTLSYHPFTGNSRGGRGGQRFKP